MTPDDLIDDLSRLLREGLVTTQPDGWDEDPAATPRFYPTQRGKQELLAGVGQADDQEEPAHGAA